MKRVFLNCLKYGTLVLVLINSVWSLTGNHVCPEHQKYNVTKRIKYRAPMAVKSYKWCMAVPPRCSVWTTEMRDATRLETEERSAEVAVCCPGFKISGNVCVPKCDLGKKGSLCDEACDTTEWGPSCTNRCSCSINAACSPIDGTCGCFDGWKGRNCEERKESSSTSKTPEIDSISKDLTVKKNNATQSNKTEVDRGNMFTNISTKDFREIASVTKLRVQESDIIIIVSQPPTENSVTTPTTSNKNTRKNISTIFKHDDTILTSKVNSTTVNNFVEEVVHPKTSPEPKYDVGRVTSSSEDDDSIKNINLNEFENNYTKHKMTTPKTIVVSIIPTTADVSINRQGASLGKSNKNETWKKNGTVVTTSPIWHIFRLPSQDKYSTIFFKNKTRAPYYYNSTSKTLFTTKSPLTFKFSSNLTTLIPILPSTNYIKIKLNESDLKVMRKRNDPKFSLENILKIYSLLKQDLNRKPTATISISAIADLENRTHFETKVNSKKTFFIKDIKYKTNNKKSNDQSLNSSLNTVETNHTISRKPASTNFTAVASSSLLKNSSSVANSNSKDQLSNQNEDDILHVLTEPAAAVADDSLGEGNSNLFSVLIIACGVTVIVISLAVLIVMIDQCKVERRKYSDDILKSNLQSNHQMKTFPVHIAHVPLPKPPLPEGHYQPISTLDKQLKQFMRPVIINKPVTAKMLDDFRDIIESHYDHLPVRNSSDLKKLRRNVDDQIASDKTLINTGESSKSKLILASSCEKINVADDNTSTNFYNNVEEYYVNNDEPLYDEIPALQMQKPDELLSSERGEAVTEL